jgi:hypothetical protein
MCGEDDQPVRDSNLAMARILTNSHIPNRLTVLAQTGHLFAPVEVDPYISGHVSPLGPKDVAISTLTPDAGKAYWISLDAIEKWGKLSTINADCVASNRIRVAATNVKAFTIAFNSAPALSFPLFITINGGPDIEVTSGKPSATFTWDSGEWKGAPLASVSRLPIKVAGLCGPSLQIGNGPVLVVYGSINPENDWLLKERAFRILSTCIGTDIGQMGAGRFAIKKDTEFDNSDIARYNIWLIGGPADNSVVAKIQAKLPLGLNSTPSAAKQVVFSGESLLLSYVFPSPGSDGRYMYVEMGSEPYSYHGSIIPSPSSDIVIQKVHAVGSYTVFSGSFDSNWMFFPSRLSY